MSVYGGDSWGREAQYRKRRVDDLLAEGINPSFYKKLSNGKYACIVCPSNPILDTSLMLSTHMKGSRHRSAESKMKQRSSLNQCQMMNKRRIAVSECSVSVQIPQHCRSSGIGNISSSMQGLEKRMMDNHSSTVCVIKADERTIHKHEITAGWKRDCHGKWFKDENAEFDSDEEDPNFCFSS